MLNMTLIAQEIGRIIEETGFVPNESSMNDLAASAETYALGIKPLYRTLWFSRSVSLRDGGDVEYSVNIDSTGMAFLAASSLRGDLEDIKTQIRILGKAVAFMEAIEALEPIEPHEPLSRSALTLLSEAGKGSVSMGEDPSPEAKELERAGAVTIHYAGGERTNVPLYAYMRITSYGYKVLAAVTP
jgi:hypothetical protein